jgi:hypothetical protein
MSEPDYVESYQLDELTTRVELLEALHRGGLAVAEQHAAMVRELRQLSSYLSIEGCRKAMLQGDWKHSMKQIDELLAWIQGDSAAPHVEVTEVVGCFRKYDNCAIAVDRPDGVTGYVVLEDVLPDQATTPEREGPRGRYRVTVEFWPEDKEKRT